MYQHAIGHEVLPAYGGGDCPVRDVRDFRKFSNAEPLARHPDAFDMRRAGCGRQSVQNLRVIAPDIELFFPSLRFLTDRLRAGDKDMATLKPPAPAPDFAAKKLVFGLEMIIGQSIGVRA